MDSAELLEVIIKKIENNGINLKTGSLDGPPAVISSFYKIGIYDLERVTAFDLAHEFIHTKYKDCCRFYDNDVLNPSEKRANKEAILLLWDKFVLEGGSFECFNQFIEISGCPRDFALQLLSKVNSEVIKELNKEDSQIKDYSKMSLKECVIDYISHFDVVEQINTYRFLEAYNLPYEKYDAAVEIFKTVLHLDYAC
ncbi:hypothetical protein SFB95_02805 [Lactococcus garvieae]|uniref:hypothetical protein n=1 Tax=Lactococcus garvieae TaxID=1363 RepID=UPI00398234BC